jgi:hypothetical protein
MAVQIQLRNDTAANWTSSNPTLAQGEMGVETDTLKFKIGNGSTAWTSLAYAPYNALSALSDVQITSVATGQVLTYNGTKWANAATAEAGFNGFLLMGA